MTTTVEPLTSTNTSAAGSTGSLEDVIDHPDIASGSDSSKPSGGLHPESAEAATLAPVAGVRPTGPGRHWLAREQVAAAAMQSRASNTNRAYASDWARFSVWCERRGLPLLPARPQAVATPWRPLRERRQIRPNTWSCSSKRSGWSKNRLSERRVHSCE